MIKNLDLPIFPYHRNPIESESLRESNAKCDCCGKVCGVMYDGVIYSVDEPENICPWCIANGKASEKYDSSFFDAYFVDENDKDIEVDSKYYSEVFFVKQLDSQLIIQLVGGFIVNNQQSSLKEMNLMI